MQEALKGFRLRETTAIASIAAMFRESRIQSAQKIKLSNKAIIKDVKDILYKHVGNSTFSDDGVPFDALADFVAKHAEYRIDASHLQSLKNSIQTLWTAGKVTDSVTYPARWKAAISRFQMTSKSRDKKKDKKDHFNEAIENLPEDLARSLGVMLVSKRAIWGNSPAATTSDMVDFDLIGDAGFSGATTFSNAAPTGSLVSLPSGNLASPLGNAGVGVTLPITEATAAAIPPPPSRTDASIPVADDDSLFPPPSRTDASIPVADDDSLFPPPPPPSRTDASIPVADDESESSLSLLSLDQDSQAECSEPDAVSIQTLESVSSCTPGSWRQDIIQAIVGAARHYKCPENKSFYNVLMPNEFYDVVCTTWKMSSQETQEINALRAAPDAETSGTLIDSIEQLRIQAVSMSAMLLHDSNQDKSEYFNEHVQPESQRAFFKVSQWLEQHRAAQREQQKSPVVSVERTDSFAKSKPRMPVVSNAGMKQQQTQQHMSAGVKSPNAASADDSRRRAMGTGASSGLQPVVSSQQYQQQNQQQTQQHMSAGVKSPNAASADDSRRRAMGTGASSGPRPVVSYQQYQQQNQQQTQQHMSAGVKSPNAASADDSRRRAMGTGASSGPRPVVSYQQYQQQNQQQTQQHMSAGVKSPNAASADDSRRRAMGTGASSGLQPVVSSQQQNQQQTQQPMSAGVKSSNAASADDSRRRAMGTGASSGPQPVVSYQQYQQQNQQQTQQHMSAGVKSPNAASADDSRRRAMGTGASSGLQPVVSYQQYQQQNQQQTQQHMSAGVKSPNAASADDSRRRAMGTGASSGLQPVVSYQQYQQQNQQQTQQHMSAGVKSPNAASADDSRRRAMGTGASSGLQPVVSYQQYQQQNQQQTQQHMSAGVKSPNAASADDSRRRAMGTGASYGPRPVVSSQQQNQQQTQQPISAGVKSSNAASADDSQRRSSYGPRPVVSSQQQNQQQTQQPMSAGVKSSNAALADDSQRRAMGTQQQTQSSLDKNERSLMLRILGSMMCSMYCCTSDSDFLGTYCYASDSSVLGQSCVIRINSHDMNNEAKLSAACQNKIFEKCMNTLNIDAVSQDINMTEAVHFYDRTLSVPYIQFTFVCSDVMKFFDTLVCMACNCDLSNMPERLPKDIISKIFEHCNEDRQYCVWDSTKENPASEDDVPDETLRQSWNTNVYEKEVDENFLAALTEYVNGARQEYRSEIAAFQLQAQDGGISSEDSMSDQDQGCGFAEMTQQQRPPRGYYAVGSTAVQRDVLSHVNPIYESVGDGAVTSASFYG